VRHASLVIVGGRVWAPATPAATAVAVEGERISALGSDADIRALIDRNTRVIDARGGTILPAFNDAHVHFLMASRSLGELDLFGADTQAEVERRIRDYAASRKSEWVVGRGWFYSAFPRGMPTIELLDSLVPDRPAYLESFDAHTGWANTRALTLAGMSSEGVLKEAAMLGVTRHIPARSKDQELVAMRAGMKLAASRGVGSVQEAGGGQGQLHLWKSLQDAGALTLRVRLAFDMVPALDAATWNRRLGEYAELARDRKADPWITTGILKAFADGVVESRTAAMLEPYEGTDELGAPLWGDEELAQAVRIADARGWQVQVHAIGDAAIRQALDAFAGSNPARRHRVEHIEAPAATEVGRFAEVGVIASVQPQHAEPVKNLLEIWAPNLGPERSARGWPWGSILGSGARLAFGTDWPVVPLDPAASLHVAVNRQTLGGEPPGGWIPAERLGMAEAVAAWTSGGAYAEHMEGQKGSLEVGMFADIAVLDRDLAAIDASAIKEIKVEATVVGGRLVYES
jgi:predicted amidohydrolase YtcJ